MKKCTVILLSLIPLFGVSQEFEKSANYTFNEIDHLMTSEYFSQVDSLRDPLIITVKEKATGEVKKSFEIYSAESFGRFLVEEMPLSGYKQLKSVVKVSYEWSGCCSDVYEEYFLVKNNGKWIPMPLINYFTCDWPAEIPAYSFISDQHPVVQKIQFVTNFHNDTGQIEKSEIVESFNWNGKFLVKIEE